MPLEPPWPQEEDLDHLSECIHRTMQEFCEDGYSAAHIAAALEEELDLWRAVRDSAA